MKGDRVPSEHHVGLHCAPSVLLSRDANGQIDGVSAAAFRVDPDGISVNWLEYHAAPGVEPFAAMSGLLKSVRKVKPSHRIGVIAVADIEATPGAAGASLHVEHDPLDGPPNPSHSLIKGVSAADEDVLHELSALVEVQKFV